MRYRTRLYIAFTSIAVLTLVLGGINLFSSSQVRDMEKKVLSEERIALLTQV